MGRRLITGALLIVGLSSLLTGSAEAGAGSNSPVDKTPKPRLTWLALGDSYSSGEGIDNAYGPCAQHEYAYASMARIWFATANYAHRRTDVDFDFTACTGARLRGTKKVDYPIHLPRQLTMAPLQKYDLITFTIGGNDLGFSDIIKGCQAGRAFRAGKPRHCKFDLEAKLVEIDRLGRHLAEDYASKIRPRLAPGGQIVILSYPYLVADPKSWPSRTCNGLTKLDGQDLNTAGKRLTTRIREAVVRADGGRRDFHFVDVQQGAPGAPSWEDHNLCASKGRDLEWMNGLTLLNAPGRTIKTPLGSFHPNQKGHEGEAKMLDAVLRRLDWSKLSTNFVLAFNQGYSTVFGTTGAWFGVDGSQAWLGPVMQQLVLTYTTVALGGPPTETRTGDRVRRRCGDRADTALLWGQNGEPDFGVLLRGGSPVGYRMSSSGPRYRVTDDVPIGSDIFDLIRTYGSVRWRDVTVEGRTVTEFEIKASPPVRINGPLKGTIADGKVIARGEGEQCGFEDTTYRGSQIPGPSTSPGPGSKSGRLFRVGEYHWEFRPYSDWLHQDEKSRLFDIPLDAPKWQGTFRIDKSGKVSGIARSRKYLETVRCEKYRKDGVTWGGWNAYIQAKSELTLTGSVEGKQLKLTVQRHGFEMKQLGSGDKGKLVPKGCDGGVGLSAQGKREVASLKKAFTGSALQVTAQPNDFLRIWSPKHPAAETRCYPGKVTPIRIEGSDFEFTMYPSDQTDPRPHRIMPLAAKGKRGCA